MTKRVYLNTDINKNLINLITIFLTPFVITPVLLEIESSDIIASYGVTKDLEKINNFH